jgi:uncharacterized repeat protein (TIGR01451 family)
MFVRRAIAVLLAGTAGVGIAGAAHAQTSAAQLTTAGTRIDNTASVTYSVNGTNQSTTSTTASFVVDKKVNFTVVTAQTGPTAVNLNDQNAVTTFRVTNLTNDVQDFLLDPDQQNISLGLFPGSDNFDLTSLRAYVDSNGNGRYDAGVDTQTYIDELAPDASVEVFLVGDVPANNNNITLAQVSLHVTAAAGGQASAQGSALVASLSLGNADNTVDVVFADDDDDGIGADQARDGQGRAYAAFSVNITNVALTVTKTALVISDPVNGSLNPKPLPGAVVQYCLLVNNATSGTSATNVVLTDVVPTGTTFVAGSISMGTPGGTCVGSGTATGTAFDTGTNTVTANVGTVAGGASYAAAFRVSVN